MMLIAKGGGSNPFFPLLLAGAATVPLTLLLIHMLKKLAFAFGILDYPGERKVQQGPVALLGGFPFLIAFLSGSLYLIVAGKSSPHLSYPPCFWGLMTGSCLVFLTGLLDDIFKDRFPIQLKLAGQFFSAFIAVLLGVRFHLLQSDVLNIGFSFLWLFWLPNAINMLDNMDGLAGGCSVFIFGAFITIFHCNGISWSFFLCLLIFVSVVAFLFSNFPPSSIYMGDAGSHFLGFTMACFSMNAVRKMDTGIGNLVFLVFLFCVPLLDNLYVVSWRLCHRKSIYVGDRNHLSHFLLKKGYNINKVLLPFYTLALIGASLAVALYLL